MPPATMRIIVQPSSARSRCALPRRVRFFVLCIALAVATSVTAASDQFVGRPLVDVIEELRKGGLRLIYNTQLVPAELRVTREPAAADPVQMLQAMLEPHGLGLSRVGEDVYAVVALPKRDEAPPPAATAESPLPHELL